MRRLPRIHCTTPAQTQEEQDKSGEEEDSPDVVELLDLLHLTPALELLLERRRKVEEEKEGSRREVDDDHHVVAPAPASCGVKDEGFRYGGTKAGEWDGEEVHDRVGVESVLNVHVSTLQIEQLGRLTFMGTISPVMNAKDN